VPGAATYQLQIATNPDMANGVYSAVTLFPHHTPVKRLGNSIYYWRVTPFDNKGHAGAASPVWSFTFHWGHAPQLLGPAHGADLPFSPRFSWTAVEAAKEYRLQISTQDNFVTYEQIVTRNTDYTPFQAFSNDQDYFWRVQAVDGQSTASPWHPMELPAGAALAGQQQHPPRLPILLLGPRGGRRALPDPHRQQFRLRPQSCRHHAL
jgi:hypothetical protein